MRDVMRDLIEKFSVIRNWSPPRPPFPLSLKAYKDKFDDKGEVAGSCYCEFPHRNLIKINKEQSTLSVYGPTVLWRVELLKYYISETKPNSSVETSVAFVEKVSKAPAKRSQQFNATYRNIVSPVFASPGQTIATFRRNIS